jgi:hypothetical protein
MRTGRVYRIVAIEGPEVYVGSTFLAIRDRFISHKKQYKQWKNDKGGRCSVYELFDKYGVDGCRMILIKEYMVEDRAHLEVYETLWVKKMKAINRYEPCGRLLIKQYQKQRYKANKERINEQQKQYKEANKEYIKEQRKKFREANTERIKEQMKQYYEANKERLNEKITCECGAEITRHHIARHRKSKTHADGLQAIQ